MQVSYKLNGSKNILDSNDAARFEVVGEVESSSAVAGRVQLQHCCLSWLEVLSQTELVLGQSVDFLEVLFKLALAPESFR